MRHYLKSTLVILFLIMGIESAFAQSKDGFRWWNPTSTSFPVIEGQGWHEGLANPYDRLPAKAKKSVRSIVWHLSQESAGLVIRFRSNAEEIRVRYTVGGKLVLLHMPATGVSGVDLYALNKDGEWEWSGGKYHFGDTITYDYKSLKNDYTREFHLYLPLYNNVNWLEIGVPVHLAEGGDSVELTPLPLRKDKPIVVYGTSIAQGACASRPGMAWTAILGRRLHRPVINLAFSGNGRLEKPVVDLLTELEPEIYVIDCLPNMIGYPNDTIKARLTNTINGLRKEKPDIPVLIVEYPNANIRSLDKKMNASFDLVNKLGDSVFTKLKLSGMRNIYLLTSHEIGLDIESTVEGVHPNDYGMELYAKAYEKAIRRILDKPVGK